jgi:hypothetical protein
MLARFYCSSCNAFDEEHSMIIRKVEVLIDKGSFSQSTAWKRIQSDILESIKSLEHPIGAGKFILRDELGKKRGKGSGVKPIRDMFCKRIREEGWNLETKLEIASRLRPGPLDATKEVGNQLFAVEWETGNISSSHRALNKLSLGIINKKFVGGALVLPTRKMYQYLTDRVGNFEELQPYFPLWRCLQCSEGLLVIFAVEQDAVDKTVPRLLKGTDGRALV